MVQGKLTAAGCNVVHCDEIWKDHVHHEHTAMKRWPETWGFLQNEYRSLNQTINNTRSNWLQQSLQASPSSSGDEPEEFHLPPLVSPKQQQQSSNPFPRTTAREVGWRSARKDCGLELYGRWARGKGSILKQLKWPHDAVP